MDDHEMRAECKAIMDSMAERIKSVEQSNREHDAQIGENNIDIGVLKTNVSNLVKSIDTLSKSIWGMVLAIAGTGVGFIIWFIQSKGA